MPDHKGFKLQWLVNFQKFSTLRVNSVISVLCASVRKIQWCYLNLTITYVKNMFAFISSTNEVGRIACFWSLCSWVGVFLSLIKIAQILMDFYKNCCAWSPWEYLHYTRFTLAVTKLFTSDIGIRMKCIPGLTYDRWYWSGHISGTDMINFREVHSNLSDQINDKHCLLDLSSHEQIEALSVNLMWSVRLRNSCLTIDKKLILVYVNLIRFHNLLVYSLVTFIIVTMPFHIQNT